MTLNILLTKLTSRKFWALVIAVVAALANLMTGDITAPQFILAILTAAGTYQVSEAMTDSARAKGVENTLATATLIELQHEQRLELLNIEHSAHDAAPPNLSISQSPISKN